jgi:DNA-binding response OmpR family regulator
VVSTEPGHILVVDDDPTVADVVAHRYLRRDGHDVQCYGRLPPPDRDDSVDGARLE